MELHPAGLGRLVRSWLEPWMEDAACACVDPEIWFPEIGQSPKDAKRICANCPVIDLCAAYAAKNKERFGVWAGQSEHDRRMARKAASAEVAA